MLTAQVLGNNLLKLIIRSNYTGIPIDSVRSVIRQVLEGICYLHDKCHIIHTDIKPENVLIMKTPDQMKAMAKEAVLLARVGLTLSGSAVSTAPTSVRKAAEANQTKTYKKKLKKKRKKQRELFDQQLEELAQTIFTPERPGSNLLSLTGLSVDSRKHSAHSSTDSHSSAESGGRACARAAYRLFQSIPGLRIQSCRTTCRASLMINRFSRTT